MPERRYDEVDDESHELVASEARFSALAAAPPSDTFLGITIGVARTVQLARHLSDSEWERLVVLLRETFDARGDLRADGSFRQWTNGNLQVLLEPTSDGDRIRMRTRNGAVQALLAGAAAILGVTAFTVVLGAARGLLGSPEFVNSLTTLGVAGAGVGLWGGIRLASWAPKRLAQMESVARQLEDEFDR